MKRILAVILTILTVSFLTVGCSAPLTKPPVAPKQSSQQGLATSNQKNAELDSQADKIQAEIDQLLTDLEKDNDEANLDKEKI